MRLLLPSIGCALLLVGCGDDAATPDAATPDAGSLDAGSLDAGGCAPRVSATIGPEGGTLSHCDGASLVVPAGAITSAAELSIERVGDVPAPFAPYVLAGPAFAFAAPGVTFADTVEVVLPHDGGTRMEMAFLTDEGWIGVEACDVTETTISQTFRALGTFAAARDPNAYPDDVTGLGEGSIAFTFGGVEDAIDVDPQGHAIDEDPSEGRSLTLLFRRSDDTALVQVDLRFVLRPDGTVDPVQIQHANTAVSEIWSADAFTSPDDMDITITRDEAGTIEGTVEATLHLGEQTRALSATFTARTEHYRYPPERACENLPEG